MEEKPAKAVRGSAPTQRAGWIAGGAAVMLVLTIMLWACIGVIPQRLYPPLTDAQLPTVSDRVTYADRIELREARLKLQNDARTTLLQGLAALLVLVGASIGALVTLRQVRISRDTLVASERQAREQLDVARQQAQTAERQAREELAIAREGQITDRFTHAVEQLGNKDSLDVRLGGIYALARIAHDSDTHRLAIFEILTAYVRGHAPWPPPPGLEGEPLYPADMPLEEIPILKVRLPDVQAALIVLGERPVRDDDPPVDLHDTDLRRADLHGTHLEMAHLRKVHLEKAYLRGAYLEKANLREAHLEETDLREAHLEKANLYLARLAGADLSWAYLDGTECIRTDLSQTNLFHAHLAKAQLVRTTLAGATANENLQWPKGIDPKAAGVVPGGPYGHSLQTGLATSNDAVQAEPKRASAGSEPTDANTT
jgi:hypothetical protein